MSIRYPDLAALFLRVSFGFMMAFGHGYDKFLKLFSGGEINFIGFLGLTEYTVFAIAVFAEFICSLMIIIGYKTRIFCLPLIITMMVAVFDVHLSDPLFMKNASGGSKEMPILYLAAFITIYLLGSGRYSIDDRIDSVLN